MYVGGKREVEKEKQMDYKQAKEYIQSIPTGAKIRPGLDTTKRLLELLGDPQEKLQFIHIAGTNGKGSTASFISTALAYAGYKVGRYVSPAVFEEREKIRWMQGEKVIYISEEEFADAISRVQVAIQSMQEAGEVLPTEFEIETAAAFLAFEEWQCDIVVLETGMGGRLDSTNVVENVVCSVITPVAMDHMKFLGDTLEEIAMEKAGIIKERIPVVVCQQEQAVRECLQRVCRQKNTTMTEVCLEQIRIRETDSEGSLFDYGSWQGIRITLAGTFQVENACLALECLGQLKGKFNISPRQLWQGFEHTLWQGRFEKISREPVVVADGAHNPAAMNSFCESVLSYYKKNKRIGIMGVFADKDYEKMAELAQGVFEKIYTITPPSQRGLPAEILAEALESRGVETEPCGSMEEALRRALEGDETYGTGSDDERVVFIFGSLSILKEACQLLY